MSVVYEHSRNHKFGLDEIRGLNGSNEESEGSTADVKQEKNYTHKSTGPQWLSTSDGTKTGH
ncbi:MAG: hypothetical protein ACE5R6_08630 [Candidatus Heimdallarchaeota archaeon]